MTARHRKPLPPRTVFLRRFLRKIVLATGVVAVSLLIGAVGYHYAEGMPWLDATLSATMILTSMGPSTPPQASAGKLFAIFYALFSGVVFVTLVAVLFAPVLHRFLHQFHLELEPEDSTQPPRRGIGPEKTGPRNKGTGNQGEETEEDRPRRHRPV